MNTKPKHLWKPHDWDNVSEFHRLHRKVSGIPLTNAIIKFYIFIVAMSLLSAIFIK